jgi:hypothetical protein
MSIKKVLGVRQFKHPAWYTVVSIKDKMQLVLPFFASRMRYTSTFIRTYKLTQRSCCDCRAPKTIGPLLLRTIVSALLIIIEADDHYLRHRIISRPMKRHITESFTFHAMINIYDVNVSTAEATEEELQLLCSQTARHDSSS